MRRTSSLLDLARNDRSPDTYLLIEIEERAILKLRAHYGIIRRLELSVGCEETCRTMGVS